MVQNLKEFKFKFSFQMMTKDVKEELVKVKDKMISIFASFLS